MSNKVKSAVWFNTMLCQMDCHYCWQVQAEKHGDFKPEKFKHDWRAWADAWNRVNPGILDVSGGEPTLMPGWVDFFKALSPSIRYAMTTNLTADMTQFVQHISPDRMFSMTCSFHPTQTKMPEALFVGRCLMLKERGFNITINFVGWPEQLWLTDHYRKMFTDLGLRFHFDPYSSIAYYPFEFSEREKAVINKFAGKDRAPADLAVQKGHNDYGVVCSGGMDHLSVQPDGSAWRCILDRQLNINPLGNILDPNFKMSEKFTECYEAWRCPGCDRDKVTIKPTNLSPEEVRQRRTPDPTRTSLTVLG